MLTYKVFSRFKVLTGALGLFLCGALGVGVAHATVILEGSDAIGLHSRGADAGAITYRDQTWSAIGGADARPIAFIGDALSGVGSGTHTVSTFSSVAAAGTLSNYVALYFQAGGGCCSENDTLITAAGAATAVGSYLTAGGTVMIGNYVGGASWDFAVGTSGGGYAHVAGYGGGLPGSSCSDRETVTATGTANGFTQPPSIGCWTHQAYDQAGFFGAKGFTLSFFDGGVDYPAGFSSLLSNGKTVTGGGGGTVPEPASLALLGIGLAGIRLAGMGAMRRKQMARKQMA